MVFFENKASRAYFADPETDERLRLAGEYLASLDIAFERIVGTDIMEPMWWRVVRDVYDDRATAFGEPHVAAARELLARDGGTTPLGRLHEVLSPDRRHARAIANAMLVRREVGFAVRRPLHPDLPVHRPAASDGPSRLRALLSLHGRP